MFCMYSYAFDLFLAAQDLRCQILGHQRTLGDEAMAELGARQELYYANSGAEDPGYSKAS